jgi:hypothetical protein
MEPPAELETAWAELRDDSKPLAALRAARQLRDGLGPWEAHLAREALAAGETWETIGEALGTSRQAAWERLRRGIAAEIDADKARIRAERQRLQRERRRS